MPPSVTLNVRGEAPSEVPPDYAWVSIDVSATDADQSVALARAQLDAAGLRAAVEGTAGVRWVVLPRVRVRQEYRYNEQTREQEPVGWNAQMAGRVEVAVAQVGVVAQLVVGAHGSITGVTWLLEDDNPAYREVRRAAVEDAFRAAVDFADALGRPLGSLRTLADPGLLRGDGRSEAPVVARAMMAGAGPDRGGSGFEFDPEPQRLFAAVEATFDVL